MIRSTYIFLNISYNAHIVAMINYFTKSY